MSRTPIKFVKICGVSVWAADENGAALYDTPQASDVSVSVPSIEFGTTDVNILGTLSVPDFSRLENFQLSATIPIDNPEAKKLMKLGLQNWVISYAVANLDSSTGLEQKTGYRIYARGYVSSIPNAEISTGGEGTADVSMNLVSLKKWALGASVPEFNIDRLAGKVEIDGVNYAAEVNALY